MTWFVRQYPGDFPDQPCFFAAMAARKATINRSIVVHKGKPWYGFAHRSRNLQKTAQNRAGKAPPEPPQTVDKEFFVCIEKILLYL